MALKVEIVDREGVLWHGDADYVSVPSAEGDLGILPGRQPILVVLRQGVVRIVASTDKKEVEIPVESGFASADSNAVTVVSEKSLEAQD